MEMQQAVTRTGRIVPNFVRDGKELPPVADCRNCNHKALGTRRTR
jgi:hypothetical protein